MTREQAKELFREDKDSYGRPRSIMKKIDKIYDDFYYVGKLYIGYVPTTNLTSEAELVSSEPGVCERMLKGVGWHGRDGFEEHKYCLIVDGKIFILDQENPLPLSRWNSMTMIKETALAKLTSEEKKVLGLG